MIGPAPSDEEARDMIKGYQSRGIFVFLIGGIIDQARRMGVNMNFKVRVVDVGPDIWCVSHVVNLVMRAAMIFGAIGPEQYNEMNKYTFERIFAFVNAFTPVSDITRGDKVIKLPTGDKCGPYSEKLYHAVQDIQYGVTPDTHNWCVEL